MFLVLPNFLRGGRVRRRKLETISSADLGSGFTLTFSPPSKPHRIFLKFSFTS